MTAPTRPTGTTVKVADLSAGDVVRLPDWTHPAVVEAISDVNGAHRSIDVTHLTFGTSPGRLVLPVRDVVERLDLQVWWHLYTNVSDRPMPAWVRGHRVVVPVRGRVSLVDVEHRAEFDADTWRHDRRPVRPDLLERPGWQTLRPSAEVAVGQSLTG